MAEAIGVCGFQGTGKTTALRTLDPKKTMIISPFKQSLSFAGSKKNYTPLSADGKTGNFAKPPDLHSLNVLYSLVNDERPDIKIIVTEDYTHYFNRCTLSGTFREKGKNNKENWSRWGDLGAEIYQALFGMLPTFRSDLLFVFHFHPETYVDDTGEKLKIKTPGQLLDREVDIPSYFTYLFYTKVLPPNEDLKPEDRYKYVTNNDGFHSAKTPYGCFPDLYIPNDLGAVLKRIKEYENEG